jgi:hypothetical protein
MNDFIYAIKETKWYIFWYTFIFFILQLIYINPFLNFFLGLTFFMLIYGIGSVMIEQRKIYKKYLNDKGDK